MAHLRACEVRQLLHNKFVVVLGDSIQRAVYKDLVLLLQKDRLLSARQLKTKGELSFERDVLLAGGRRGRVPHSTHYREVRQFCSGQHLVRFYFLTRAYSQYLEDILAELRWGEHAPDVVIMNSCLWDLSRYGRAFRRSYRMALESLFQRLDEVLPESCLLLWNTAMPAAETASGGRLPPPGQPCRARLRRDVMEANFYSSAEAGRHGFDVLDLHFHFRHAGRHRLPDGVHWDERAHRRLSQLLLAHVADAWGVALPRRRPRGRYSRDGPARARPGATGRGHPHAGRGDPRESASSWLPPPFLFLCAPRRSSLSFPDGGIPFPPDHHDEHGRLPSHPPFYRQPLDHPSAHQSEPTSYAAWRAAREPRPGPIRRVFTEHRGRRSPPYPPRSPREPRRQHRRRTDRRPQAHAAGRRE